MKKLVINKKAQKLLEENGVVANYSHQFECVYGDWRALDVSQFRFYLHKLVELYNFEDKKQLNEEISENNFTGLIMNGILNIEEK